MLKETMFVYVRIASGIGRKTVYVVVRPAVTGVGI